MYLEDLLVSQESWSGFVSTAQNSWASLAKPAWEAAMDANLPADCKQEKT